MWAYLNIKQIFWGFPFFIYIFFFFNMNCLFGEMNVVYFFRF